jgi:recombination protein RecT
MSTTALTEKPTQDLAKVDLKNLLSQEKIKAQITKALPSHLKPDRFLRVATTALMRTPKLANCTTPSFMKCLLELSAFGLEPDGRRAHLIPFENRKQGTTECTLIIDWKGLAELAMRSGIITKLHADLVCENDVFEYDLGAIVSHKIDWKKDRGEPYAAYAMAETKDGAKFVQVLTKAEIEKIRDSSQGYRAAKQYNKTDNPWMTAPGEMWKKTCFRRLSKWLPLSAEFRDAVERDDEDYEQLPEREVTPQVSAPKFLKQPEPPTDHGGFADHDLMTDEKPECHEEGEGVAK